MLYQKTFREYDIKTHHINSKMKRMKNTDTILRRVSSFSIFISLLLLTQNTQKYFKFDDD